MRSYGSCIARVVVLGILLAGLPLLAPGASAFPGANGKIAFTNIDINNDPNIWVMNPDGSGRRQLTSDFGMSPAWSPDGRRLAFTGVGGIWVMRADGTGRRFLRAGEEPAWSPDGYQIAFTASDGIWLMRADGSGARRLTSVAGDRQPAWSPDGARIAFRRGNNVHTINLRTRVARQLTRFSDDPPPGVVSYYAASPAWSPSGGRIAFAIGATGPCFDRYAIATINADGTRQRTVVDYFGWLRIPGISWSPDGRRILFDATFLLESLPDCEGVFSSSDLFAVRLDGTTPVNLTNTPGEGVDEVDPDWQAR
jgi:Tol biopolymer transport system component